MCSCPTVIEFLHTNLVQLLHQRLWSPFVLEQGLNPKTDMNFQHGVYQNISEDKLEACI